MNWTKPNFTQWVAIITTIVAIAGYVGHIESVRTEAQKAHEQTLIEQHDQEQRIDSIATAFAIFVKEFRDLQKNRTETTRQRDQEKKEVDERTQVLYIRLAIMETEFHDYLKFKKS